MLIGQIWGLSRFVLDIIFPAPVCGEEDGRPALLKYWHVFYHVVSQIVLTVVLGIILSFCLKVKTQPNLNGVTFWTMDSQKESQEEKLYLQQDEGKSDDGTNMDVTEPDSAIDDVQKDTEGIPIKLKMQESTISETVNLSPRLKPKNKSSHKLLLNAMAVAITICTIGLYVYFR